MFDSEVLSDEEQAVFGGHDSAVSKPSAESKASMKSIK